MGWIEAYKSKGQRYYRYMMRGQSPIHLGTAEAILRKVRADDPAERKIKEVSPTEIRVGEEPRTHEPGGDGVIWPPEVGVNKEDVT